MLQKCVAVKGQKQTTTDSGEYKKMNRLFIGSEKQVNKEIAEIKQY